MDNLNFFLVDGNYVEYLREEEKRARGFTRVPDMNYGKQRKEKFLCGVVLQIKQLEYYVPVSSYKIQKPDNFLILASSGTPTSSLRFNYMFPVPNGLLKVRSIKNEPDEKYRTLLHQELSFCIKNQDKIRKLAERTYKRVLLGKDVGLVVNSCDFALLEAKCADYTKD